MQKIDGKQISIILTNEQLAELDRLADKYGIPRSKMTRNMIDVGMTVTKDLETVGVLKVASVIEDVTKIIREWRQPKLI